MILRLHKDSLLFKALLHSLRHADEGKNASRTLETLIQAKSTTHYQNDRPNGRQRADLNKQSGGLMYSQLHYEVQVVWALVDVLQSHDVLMLYPGEGEQRITFVCSQPLFISVQATNEEQLASSFVKMTPRQMKTVFILCFSAFCYSILPVFAIACVCLCTGVSSCVSEHIIHTRVKTFCMRWRAGWGGGILRGCYSMKRQPLSAGAPEEDNIGRIKTLGACVQATNQQGFSKRRKKNSLCKEICRWQSVFRRAGGWKRKGGGGRRGGRESLKGLNNLHNFLYESRTKMRLQFEGC